MLSWKRFAISQVLKCLNTIKVNNCTIIINISVSNKYIPFRSVIGIQITINLREFLELSLYSATEYGINWLLG